MDVAPLRLHLFDVQLRVKPTGRKLVPDTNTTVDAYYMAQKRDPFHIFDLQT
jgi:hypothetical protein